MTQAATTRIWLWSCGTPVASPRSDHVPVSADFVFAMVPVTAPAAVIISRLLPDPVGRDVDLETVTLKNVGATRLELDGWRLEDADGHAVSLNGLAVAPGAELVITRRGSPLSLNNHGDTVRLRDPSGVVRSERSYSAPEVREGEEIVLQ